MYAIIREDVTYLLNNFTDRVSDCIEKGWKLQGGLVLLESGNKIFAYQAMIREGK